MYAFIIFKPTLNETLKFGNTNVCDKNLMFIIQTWLSADSYFQLISKILK